MFKNKKVTKALLSIIGTSIMFGNSLAWATRYAKITLLGEKGSGKTTLHKVIDGDDSPVGDDDQTMDINSQEVLFKVNDEEVICYFWDLPGLGEGHSAVLKKFYSDSHVAILVLDVNYLRNKYGDFIGQQYTRELMQTLKGQSTTVIYALVNYEKHPDSFFKHEVENYMNNVVCHADYQHQFVGWISMPDIDELNTPEGRTKCKDELYKLVNKALGNCGIKYLPTNSKGLHGRLEWEYEFKDQWEVPDGKDSCGTQKYRKLDKPNRLQVGKHLALKTW